MMKGATPSRSVDEYISLQGEAFRETLEEMRHIILSVIPGAEQVIAYHIPIFKVDNDGVVGIGVTRKHCSLYVMSNRLTEELKDLDVAGTTVHFEPGKKLPVSMIKKIVKLRLKENMVRHKAKKKK